MKLSISKKFCKRSIKILAMFAPLAYLFGSLFFGLNGAHGGIDFADEPTLYQGITYEEAMKGDKFSYDLFDWSSSRGTRFGFSLGELSIQEADNLYETFLDGYSTGVEVRSEQPLSYQNLGLGFSGDSPEDEDWGDTPYVTASLDGATVSLDDYYVPSTLNVYFPFYCKGTGDSWYFYVLQRVDSFAYEFSSNNWVYLELSDITFPSGSLNIYFDDLSHFKRLNNSANIPTALVEYFTPSLKSFETESKSNYIFGQFFAKDNFLQQWGENAISDNPKGFAPFGTFLKYIDDNMLHLSDSQIGLMAYGYLYYTLHVLIAFFAFDILGFIPLFLQRVTDKIGGTDDD